MTTHDDLHAYFGGETEGAMGLKSWLGRWADYGPVRGGQSGSSAPEPGGGALEAARTMNRVEDVLAMLDREYALVLRAFYSPRAPNAWGAQRLGAYAAVVHVAPRQVRAVLGALRMRRVEAAESHYAQVSERVRSELRAGSAEGARHELEMMPLLLAGAFDPHDELETLFGAGATPRRRVLEQIQSAAQQALKEAQDAYWTNAEIHDVQKRYERTLRFRGAAAGR